MGKQLSQAELKALKAVDPNFSQFQPVGPQVKTMATPKRSASPGIKASHKSLLSMQPGMTDATQIVP